MLQAFNFPTISLHSMMKQAVINHNTPGVPKIYIHRVGRTARAETKLKEYPMEEKEVLKILTQVNVTRRECEIRLESTDFDEKKEINKRKQLILEGKDPDLEAKRKAELEKIRSQKKKFKQKIQESIQRQKHGQLKKKQTKHKKAELTA
ncbi:hypothetical protein XENOCAPTIV_030946 [Xenoophorus captivus]|uniref:Uncharacterized protein n=1 Tax=Xenoophorus captivus TaxID=1517983 RepID=A0ABV0RYP5_9TELE